MKIIPVSELYGYNFSVEVINTLRLHWRNRECFDCLQNPKKTDLLLYLHKCRGEYTLPDGSKIYAEPGNLVYTPAGSRYQLRIFDIEDAQSSTVGTNFLLLDHENKPFLLSDAITVFPDIDCQNPVNELEQISSSMHPSPARMKARFYDIMIRLSDDSRQRLTPRFQIISEGIHYMENDPKQELSIAQVADLCSISEIYFRRLFKEYAGCSPIEYRLKAKLERAKQLLLYETLSTEQITDLLNFSTPSYFCSQFKKHTGKTPMEYRKKYTQQQKATVTPGK